MTHQLTASQEAAQETVPPGRVPTDHDDRAGLYEFLAGMPRHLRWIAHAWLHRQNGGQLTDWETLVDGILPEVEHDEEIADARTDLNRYLGMTASSLAASIRTADRLAGQVYDVEHAESADSTLMRHYLAEAERALRVAERFNPTRATDRPA